MAMYDEQGFCPSNSFMHYLLEGNEVPDIWNRTHELLGERIGYMVYTENGRSFKEWPYVVDCLMGAESTIGVEIACLLKMWIPQCEYGKSGRKIWVTDLINPLQIPYVTRNAANKKFESTNERMFVFEDERYLCGMTEECEDVHIYFYKKKK